MCVKILIGHHEQPQLQFLTMALVLLLKSSTSEMVYDFVMASGHAQLLIPLWHNACIQDWWPIRVHFPATTASVHRAIAHFKRPWIDHRQIHEEIYDNFLESRLRLLICFVEQNEVCMNTIRPLCISSPDLHKFDIKTGDTEGLVVIY
jgi:phosphoesterase RecJ-like protein